MSHELRNDDKGRYLISTATGSHYCLDLDNKTLIRQMAVAPPIEDFLDVDPSRLRRDREAVDLLSIEHCRVGEPARLWIRIRPDAVTLRTTSPVVRIEPVVPDHG